MNKLILLGGISLLLVVIILLGAYYSLISGHLSEGSYTKQVFWGHPHAKAIPELKTGDEFVVMSWNIAFAHGVGSEGKGYQKKSEKEYLGHIDRISQILTNNNVDLFLAQEIDFDSYRTYHLNEAQLIAAQVLYSDIAPVVSWKLNYLPFPGEVWERHLHFRSMNSGGAILSRFRLENHSYDLLAKPKSHNYFYNMFYLYRYIQSVELRLKEKMTSVINLHLEAFDMTNRLKHIETLIKKIEQERPLIIAGDFNTFDTRGRDQLIFGDDNYTGDKSFEVLLEKLPGEYGEALNDDFVFLGTFPANEPDRRLDYIFYDKEKLELLEAKVVQEGSEISDHLPILAKFRVR